MRHFAHALQTFSLLPVYNMNQETKRHRFFDGRMRSVYEAVDPELKKGLQKLNTALTKLLFHNPQFWDLYDHNVVHGFLKDRNPQTHARVHRGAKTIVQLDLYHAFESTGRWPVLVALANIGAEAGQIEQVAQNTFIKDFIPAGFPTSPVLFNIAMLELDLQMVEFSKDHSLKYSRYGDDLAVSSRDEHLPQTTIQEIINLIKAYGYDPHKIRVGHPRSKPVKICGVSLFRGKAYINGRTKRAVRARVHQALIDGNLARAQSLMGHVVYTEGVVPSQIKKDHILAKSLRNGGKSRAT